MFILFFCKNTEDLTSMRKRIQQVTHELIYRERLFLSLDNSDAPIIRLRSTTHKFTTNLEVKFISVRQTPTHFRFFLRFEIAVCGNFRLLP